MKKALLLVLVPLLALAGTITRTIQFDSRDLEFTKANGFDVVKFADFITTPDIGKPMMPAAVFNVVVPATASVTDIKVTPLEPQEIPGSFRVHPVQTPVTISTPGNPAFVQPDPEAYGSSNPYPAELASTPFTGTKSEFRICGFMLYPLSYVPASGKLTLYRKMKVEVCYAKNAVNPLPMSLGQIELFSRDVSHLVINPEDVELFAPPVRMTDDPDVDYAIVTSSGLSTYFNTLVDWRCKKGNATQVFTTDWINTNYPSGRDLQERIRLFIIDYYAHHGLKWVLLAGDNSLVPGRRCRAIVNSTNGDVPADVYYADLQWSYDGNHNNIFGEAAGDTVDFYYDLYVGRASVDNQTEVNTFITKTLYYEKTPTTDYLKKMLLPYVNLFSGYSGKVVSDTIAAITPVGWTDQYIANPTSTTPMRDAINAGYHLGHAAAHGNDIGFYTDGGIPIYTTSTASGQTNSTRPMIMNSMACISGNFEYSDCLAEAFVNNPNGGGVACMMNSREGWGTPPSMGPSEKLDSKFYWYFFHYDTMDIGVLHARSKDFYVAAVQGQEVWRWCYWDLNLFGDPNMTLWYDVPTAMTADHAASIETGPQPFTVTVTSGGNPVPKALVSCYKSGEVQARCYTNSSGVANLVVVPLTTGTMYVTVTSPSHLPVEHTVTVTTGTPKPYMSYVRHVVSDGGNGRLEPGETADLFVTIKNIGNAQATSVAGTLRTASGYITRVDSTSSYGTMNPLDTARGDAYRVTAAPGTPPGTVIPFTVHVVSNEGTWDPTFDLVVGTPILPGAVVMEHDTGYCKLSVTCLGSIGYDAPPGDMDLGFGFCYPKTGASQLYYSSFAMGNAATYVVDRYYGNPPSGGPNTDFAIAESLKAVLPPGNGDEHFACAITDAGHSSPKTLRVNQHSFQNAGTGYDDFVVLTYDIANNGSSAVNGMYAAVFADFDIGSAPTANICSSEVARRMTFIRQSSTANPSTGVKILAPQSYANLTAVDHARYVYPDSCMTDGQKWRFMNATISQPNSNRNYDWSLCVSAGPFDLAVGASYRFAVAFVGGTTGATIRENADSAQAWYDRNTGVFEEQPKVGDLIRLTCLPNPFTRSVQVSFQLPAAGHVRAQVFDISGRTVATLCDNALPAGKFETAWRPEGLANGVYLLKLELPNGSTTEKLMLLR